jgi:hypothetical protein
VKEDLDTKKQDKTREEKGQEGAGSSKGKENEQLKHMWEKGQEGASGSK